MVESVCIHGVFTLETGILETRRRIRCSPVLARLVRRVSAAPVVPLRQSNAPGRNNLSSNNTKNGTNETKCVQGNKKIHLEDTRRLALESGIHACATKSFLEQALFQEVVKSEAQDGTG